MIKRAIKVMSNDQFIPSEDNVLCFRESGEIIDINQSVYNLGIVNGTRLTLL